jgi:hypothetical protein
VQEGGRGRGSGGRGRAEVPWVENRKRSSAEASLTEVSPEKGVAGVQPGVQPGAQPPLLLQWKEKGGVERGSDGSAK